MRECWPGSLAWSADGKSLAFALRKPGTHARSVYTVAPDGNRLTDILDFNGTIVDLRYGAGGRLAMLAVEGASKEVGATQAGAPITGDLSGPTPEQRIGILDGKALHWSSPANMFVYEYDWLPDGSGFVGTAAPGDGDNNWWVAKLYRFNAKDGVARVIFTPPDARHQIAHPVVSRDGKTVAFISGIMSDFGSTGGDIYTLSVNGGSAMNNAPGNTWSARSLAWRCDGYLGAQILCWTDDRDCRIQQAWSALDSVVHRATQFTVKTPAFQSHVHPTQSRQFTRASLLRPKSKSEPSATGAILRMRMPGSPCRSPRAASAGKATARMCRVGCCSRSMPKESSR